MKQCKKILLIQLRQLGDILLTTPCITALKELNSNFEIHFLTHPMGRVILGDIPEISKLHIYDPKSKIAEAKLMYSLYQEKYGIVIDFMSNPRSALYSFVTRAKERYCTESKRSLFYTQTINKPSDDEYIVVQKFYLLKAALQIQGNVELSRDLIFLFSQEDELFADKIINKIKIESHTKKIVVISPTSRRSLRRWPVERYSELAARISIELGCHVCWIWGPGEEEVIDLCIANCEVKTSKIPKTTFKQLAAVISKGDFFIANSNGPSHLAVAVQTPSLQLHGPTKAVSWCPLNKKHSAIQAKTMNDISVTAVFEKVKNMTLDN